MSPSESHILSYIMFVISKKILELSLIHMCFDYCDRCIVQIAY